MLVNLFDFNLPEASIALRPVSPRDAARLLCVVPPEKHDKQITDYKVKNLPDLLKEGDLLVFNNTKVIPSRLHGERFRKNEGEEITKAHIELMLHLRENPSCWRAFARPAKRLKKGDQIFFKNEAGFSISASIHEKWEGGEVLLDFSLSGALLDQALYQLGELPLPPYIAGRRKTDFQDEIDYQTLYAKEEGAVAAPTAGLHFTEELFNALKKKGIETEFITLHVGAGTFLPVKVDNTDDHLMHAERGLISKESAERINEVRKNGGRIVSVGTTSLRLLESASDEQGNIHPFFDETRIFITPGYHFRCVDALVTNFHLPRSTLFMLVCAFSGVDLMKKAYEHAIHEGYRFYSYGDTSLLFRHNF